MSRAWTTISGAAVTVLLAASLAGASYAQEQRTIRYIGPTGLAVKALVDDIIPEFERRTGVKVAASFMAHEALTQKAMTEFVTGSPSFDVIMFETSWGGLYSPFMEDLEPYVAKAGEAYDADDILAAARDMGIYQGKTVGLPYRVIGRMLHYRTDLLVEAGYSVPPKTMSDLFDYAKALTRDTDGDGKPDVYGLGVLGKQGFGNALEYSTLLFSMGGSWWDLDSCEVLFDNEVGMQTMEFYANLMKEGVVPPDVTTWAWDEWIAGGQKGRYAMAIMNTPYAALLNDPGMSETAGKWGWADAPGGNGMEHGAPPVGGWLFGIASGAQDKDLAWSFVEFVTGAEAQLMSAYNANAPTRASVFRNDDVKAMWPWSETTLRALAQGTPQYNNPELLEAEAALMVRVSEALIGNKSPETIASEAADQLRAILKESGRCE